MDSTIKYLIKTKMLLTWRLYTRHTVASVESFLFLIVFILWLIGSWYLTRAITFNGLGFITRELLFADLLTFVMVLWLFFSLAGYRTNEGYDINRFRIYPLPLRTIFTANYASALLDISVLLPSVTFVAMWSAAEPTFMEFLTGIILILYFVSFLVLAGQTVVMLLYVLLPKLNLVRIFVVIFAGIMVWSILLGTGLIGPTVYRFNYYILFRPIGIEFFKPYPGGQIGIALSSIIDHDWTNALIWTGWFSLWFIGVFLFNYLLHSYWLSNDIKTVTSERKIESNLSGRFLNFIDRLISPIVPEASRALFIKDMLEFTFRSPYFILFKFLPGSIAPMIIVLAMKWNLSPSTGLIQTMKYREPVTFATVIMVLFIVIAQANLFSGNQLGLEDKNIRGLMAFPIARKEILFGKNLFWGSLFFLDTLIVSFLLLVFFSDAWVFFAAFSLVTTAMIFILGIGNFTSAIWPYWMPLDKPSFTLRSTIILGLVNLGATISLVILMILPVALVVGTRISGFEWVSWLMMPLVILSAIFFLKYSLQSAVSLLESNEFLLIRRIADAEEL